LIYGNTSGLKKRQISLLERLYRRRVQPEEILPYTLIRTLVDFSVEINRQIGLLINRKGEVTHVIVGDTKGLMLPSLQEYPLGRKALRGLRLVHTHLNKEPLTEDDLTDLALLRLDLVMAIGIKEEMPHSIYIAHLNPDGSVEVLKPLKAYDKPFNFQEFISSLQEQMDRLRTFSSDDPRERAILISAAPWPRYLLEESMEELQELAVSADVIVLDRFVQKLKAPNPKYLMGEGKLKELIIRAMALGATLLIFDQALTPSQVRAISEMTELKVIDRNQLILDIFARRAKSRVGKVQVELAQLRYMLPRLTGKGTAMSRLAGGIGGRGPGETKLEVDRRRVKERIHHLEQQLKRFQKTRDVQKRQRLKKHIPIVSIVGYTNAGKSTLLNNLTNSNTYVERRMFATLDTTTRRLRFPRDREIIITDTVGFIRDLPEELMDAFKATLEELHEADLLLHVVDISSPRFEAQIQSVEEVLKKLSLEQKPRILVFNKIDLVEPELVENVLNRFGGVAISAIDRKTFYPLIEAIEQSLWKNEDSSSYSEQFSRVVV